MTARPTLVFDVDGTLADTLPDLVAALNRTLAGLDLPAFLPSDVAHLTGKGGIRAMIAHAFTLQGRTPATVLLDRAFADTVRIYDQNIAVATQLYPGIRTALDTLRTRGWQIAVCTNKPLRQTTKLLKALEIDTFFAAVTGADSFEFRKPDPRHLLRTISMAGGLSDRAVMVGDTITDILTAHAAGVPVIAVDYGYSDVDVTTLGPDATLSQATDIVATAARLLTPS